MSLGIDYDTIDQAVYGRLVTDSAGSAARALLDTSTLMSAITGSTVKAFRLSRLERVRAAGVPPIYTAYARGTRTGRLGFEQSAIPIDWWSWGTDERPLSIFGQALEALYTRVQLATGAISCDLTVGPIYDKALNLYSMRTRLAFSIFR